MSPGQGPPGAREPDDLPIAQQASLARTTSHFRRRISSQPALILYLGAMRLARCSSRSTWLGTSTSRPCHALRRWALLVRALSR